MTIRKKSFATYAAIAIVIAFAAIASVQLALLRPSTKLNPESASRLLRSAIWRMHLIKRKASGEIPELSWADLVQMASVRGGFGLEHAADGEQSVAGSVKNPYVSDKDLLVGATLFRARCSPCHGSNGSGIHGPRLNRAGLRNGDSDYNVYKVITNGLANTTMAPVDLDFQGRWQVIGYVRQLQMDAMSNNPPTTARLRISASSEKILAAGSNTGEWLTYSGSFDGRRYSALSQIKGENVSKLRLLWSRQLGAGGSKLEATPIVINGVIFITSPPAIVIALDARTGAVLWTFHHEVPADLRLCCGQVNRGVAILDNKLFFGTVDGYLIAIDANTGRSIWETKVAEYTDGYSLTAAPLAIERSIVIGTSGGEYPIRGFLAAYDPDSGRQIWKFNTIPGPNEFGHATWKNDAWNTGGGGAWVTGSFDPSTRLIYWGVGNPNPEFNADARPGDNLFTNSVVALNADTGKLEWYFQFTPNDEHDWDSAQTPILAELPMKGVIRKVICWANRNGFYYVLDRSTGEYLIGKAFVEINWAEGLDSTGHPVGRADARVSETGRLTKPGLSGGTTWQNAAFDPERQFVFIPALESPGGVFTKAPTPGRVNGAMRLGSSGSTLEPERPVVRAVDASSGARRWERFAAEATEFTDSYGGLLSTAGGLVFGAARGQVFALDSSTGKELWGIFLGGQTFAAPITYLIDNRQVIMLLAGHTLYAFGL